MTTRTVDRIAARLLAAILLGFAVYLGLEALVRDDVGIYLFAVGFAALGLASLVWGERQ